jgi:hypothetical protein
MWLCKGGPVRRTYLEFKTEIVSQVPWPCLSKLKEISGLLVDLAILAGALAAVVKFLLFNMLGHRWRSELTCVHYEFPDLSVIFVALFT